MSIFSNILRKIFPENHPAATTPAPSATAATPTGAATPAAGAQSVPAGAAKPVAVSEVDVESILTAMAAKNSQQLNWRTSIVDLMKLLDLDSSLNSRQDLAKELGYSGDTKDSASMNIWLHKQVMKKLAENGGKVPADLKD